MNFPSQQPAASSQQPAARSPQPAASSPQPAARSPQPAARSPQPAARSPQPAAIIWPYEEIYAQWDKLARGLKKGVCRHASYPCREDIEDGILYAVELLEKKRPSFKIMAQAYVWLFHDVEYYLQHCQRAGTHLENLDVTSDFAIEDSSIHAFEIQDSLDYAFESLCHEDKELLYLNHVSGFTLKEIAGMRGLSLDSVKARHSRAMKRIRKK